MPLWVYYIPVAAVFVVTMVVAIGAVIRNARQFSTTAADPVLTSGTSGIARVSSADWTGAVINLEYVCRIRLSVEIPGREPYDVTVEQRVDPLRLASLQPGTTVAVRVDPADPVNVRIDFSQLTEPPGAESHGPPPTAAALADAYRQSPGFDSVGVGSRFISVRSTRARGAQVVRRHQEYSPQPREDSQQSGIRGRPALHFRRRSAVPELGSG
jgi:hypothetical protein